MLNRFVRATIDAGSSYRVGADALLDGVLPGIGDTRAKASAFWVLMVCSSIIAAAGVLTNSTAVVIGAMVIAPLGTPIYGISAALVTGLRSGPVLVRVLGGVLIAIAIGVLLDLVLVERMPLLENPQIISRTNPQLVDMMVALATGFAGSMALVRSDISPALPGVAIAISLVPPLAVVGICLAQGEVVLALGALLLFGTNMVAILLASILVFRGAQLGQPFNAALRASRNSRLALGVGTTLVIVLLLAGSVRGAQLFLIEQDVRSAAIAIVDNNEGWELVSVERGGTSVAVAFRVPSTDDIPDLGDGELGSELDKLAGTGVKVDVDFQVGASRIY